MKDFAIAFVSVFVVAVASYRITRSATRQRPDLGVDPAAFAPTWVMDWHGCAAGSAGECLPTFHKYASGHFRFLGCGDRGWCTLVTYEAWDERDNRGYVGPHHWDKGDPR